MSFLLPIDGYVTYLTQAVSAGDTTVYVNQLPASVTAGYLTIFELDGVTIRCKIKFTGVASSPTRLTGVTFISLTDYADTAVTGTACPKNSKVALTDNIHYTGKALAAMNGTINMEGVPKLPASRTISDVRHMIDKEYADGLAIAGYSAFFVTKDGADPSLNVNVAAGEYIKEDGSNAYFTGAASVACADDATNYVEMDTSGNVTVNQVGFTTGSYALAVVTTSGGDITAISDRRALLGTNDGVVDKIRTWSTVQSFTADNAQITTDPNSANDAVRKSYLDDAVVQNIFGDGSDGDVTISAPTTLTKDMYYENLVLNDNINTAGYKVFVKGTLTRADGKKIYNNGGAGGAGTAGGSGPTAGTAGTAGAIAGSGGTPSGLAGKAGVNGNTGGGHVNHGEAGTAGDAQTFALNANNGSAGGGGANANSSQGAANSAAGGAAGATTQAKDLPKNALKAINLISIAGTSAVLMRPIGGSGSGGSGGATAASGSQAASGGSGGSGATGGVVLLCAKNIIINGTGTFLEAKGGAGGNAGASYASGASAGAGGSGGGAGGGGGTIIIIRNYLSGTLVTDVSGGAAGTGAAGAASGTGTAGNGANGAVGSDGSVYEIEV